MGARDTDPVDIAIPSGLLLLGLPQDARMASLGVNDPRAMAARLPEARVALQDPMVAGQLRRLAARAQVQIPTGLDTTDALIDAVGVALAHRIIIGVFLPRAPTGPPVAAPAPKPAPAGATAFAGMSAEQRIRLLLERTPKDLATDLARAFRSMVTVEALAGIAAAFVVLLAAQFVGVGEIADAALAWWAYSQAGFSGLVGLSEVLRAVVSAVRAENEGVFDQAVKRFAQGLTLVGIALLTAVVTRAARKRAGGGEGGGSDAASSFNRPKPEPARQRWEIAPAAPKPTPADATKAIGTADDFGIPKFLSPRQELHIPPVTDGRSVLTADPSELLQGLHNGEFTILRQPKPGQVVIDFGKPIGEYWSNGSNLGETQFGSVSYGKKGAHIIPANPNQW